ncbi:MAG: phosphoribosylanthranilate isomerase [Pegethrix bostrychoides GSE-TBD4-15B]|jgi:phosphoribosylanthranilate isomerase|uniref:N-(5'-phosphoribosyl)anthranilate isomerase n=1 Tax=Pegethrix bostrychoides GSE-TBD4-15B TaxID=2839662 RepID=A0A951P7F7_9CYAN|nr:phosphoribosylanthranilate isomerase [Pegethrix bostrychoides GSE-TBD4-15B]
MRLKICGITQPEQALAIAQLGASALGFICVRQSPRYVTPAQIAQSAAALSQLPQAQQPLRVGVFVDASLSEIQQVVAQAQLNGVQLHGSELPQFCQQLRAALPEIQVIKAFRVRDAESLIQIRAYETGVDALLLDAFHPAQHPGEYGGTGQQIDWRLLQQFSPRCAWFLAGGITPESLPLALRCTTPDGIDVSSGVETAPGIKNLEKVVLLQQILAQKVLAQADQATGCVD